MADDRESRAIHAQQLLNDPLFQEAFDTVRAACIEQWEKTPARDVEARERIWTMVKLNERLKLHYESIINDGKMAAAEAAEIERKRLMERVRDALNV